MSQRSSDVAGNPCETLSFESSPFRSKGEGEQLYLTLALNGVKPNGSLYRLNLSRLQCVTIGRAPENDVTAMVDRDGMAFIASPDPRISGRHAQLSFESGAWHLRDLGSKNGTLVNGRRVTTAVLAANDIIDIGCSVFVFSRCPEGRDSRALAHLEPFAASALTTLNASLAGRFEELRQVANHDIPIVVCGETGTGKEVTARAIHELSGRKGAFVAVNCGSLHDAVVESELFGCAPGSRVGGADGHRGLVSRAHEGTLFLDEIANLPARSQMSLLRVLQDGEVRPVGASHTSSVDIRIVCATSENLEDRVAEGRFRADLYARLFGFTLSLLPLRKRREDLGMLVCALLNRIVPTDRVGSLSFTRPAIRALFEYEFPLNIRELEHFLRTAVALAGDGVIDVSHFPQLRETKDVFTLSEADAALRARLTNLLREHRGNVSAVARDMGKAPIQVRRWCRRFAVEIEDYRR